MFLRHSFVAFALVATFALASVFWGGTRVQAAEPSLAIVDAGVAQAEDAPFVSLDYEFLPGDYVYFTFQVGGFAVQSVNRGESRKMSITYEVVPEDSKGVPLTNAVSGAVDTELSSEDKDWMPKRRVSFLIPSFVASGEFHVHVHVKDLFGKAETSQDYPFRIGGIEIQPSALVSVQNFQFFRTENERHALEVAAYSPGDVVYARFDMVGFKTAGQNQYHMSYGLNVLRPDGTVFVDAPKAAELAEKSFYPAKYLPGNIQLKIPADAMRGEYVIVLSVHDAIGNTDCEVKRAFSIE